MMRPTRKISICLVTISIGLLFVFCNSGLPEEAKKANPRIKELQQKRLAVLEAIHDVAKQSYMNGQTSFEELHAAKVELLAARRDYAETQQDRIKACDEAVQEAIEWQKIVAKMVESSRASRVAELKAQVLVLEAQLSRQMAEANE